jgi:hypothetical protein
MIKKIKYLFIILFLFILVNNVFSAQLTDFDIFVDIRSPNKGYVTEIWNVEYNPDVPDDKENFKEQIYLANIDLDKFKVIDPKLKPNIYLRNFSNVTINFDDSKDIITINYEITDLLLQNYYETESEILWKFNENILRNLIVNNIYIISSNSRLTIKVYDPLIITDPLPKGEVNRNTISWSSISSNEIRVLAHEKKPPKPSFVLITSQESNIFYYLILLFIIIILVILFFRKPLEKSVKQFVIKNSEIKPRRVKKEFVVDSDFFED